MFGIWCGRDAAVVAVKDYSIVFLRIKNDVIASILRHSSYGIVGVVYGMGINFEAKAVYCEKHPESGELFYNEEAGQEYLEKHSQDSFAVAQDGTMVYRMYEGTEFGLVLAEEIFMEDFNRKVSVDPDMPVARRMELWNIMQSLEYGDGYVNALINTRKYSINYCFSMQDQYVYCRVGQNGYCEKGWAMLSVICIRQDECRMIEDNLRAIQEYKPMEDCFLENSCSFPEDGGWYWSLKAVTDDVIYLNGCGDATYEIHRKQ